MSYVIICVLSLILGILLCPIVIFLRARKWEQIKDERGKTYYGNDNNVVTITELGQEKGLNKEPKVDEQDQAKRMKNESKNKKM